MRRTAAVGRSGRCFADWWDSGELKVVAAAAAALQLGLTLWMNPRLLLPLAAVWACMLLLAFGFFSGLVVEIGRKVWAPVDEIPGGQTYSRLWGYKAATLTWLGAVLAAVIAGLLAAGRGGFRGPAARAGPRPAPSYR